MQNPDLIICLACNAQFAPAQATEPKCPTANCTGQAIDLYALESYQQMLIDAKELGQ